MCMWVWSPPSKCLRCVCERKAYMIASNKFRHPIYNIQWRQTNVTICIGILSHYSDIAITITAFIIIIMVTTVVMCARWPIINSPRNSLQVIYFMVTLDIKWNTQKTYIYEYIYMTTAQNHHNNYCSAYRGQEWTHTNTRIHMCII